MKRVSILEHYPAVHHRLSPVRTPLPPTTGIHRSIKLIMQAAEAKSWHWNWSYDSFWKLDVLSPQFPDLPEWIPQSSSSFRSLDSHTNSSLCIWLAEPASWALAAGAAVGREFLLIYLLEWEVSCLHKVEDSRCWILCISVCSARISCVWSSESLYESFP